MLVTHKMLLLSHGRRDISFLLIKELSVILYIGPTLKVRRHVVEKNYKATIEEMSFTPHHSDVSGIILCVCNVTNAAFSLAFGS